MTERPPAPTAPTDLQVRAALRWAWGVRAAAAAAVLVVAWASLTAWGAVVHGHPLYGVLLVATLLGAAVAGWRTRRPRGAASRRRRAAGLMLLAASLGWIALMAWLRPFTAVEPALRALRADALVAVAESPTEIALVPAGPRTRLGVLFQPGARVDPRAYAAVLRPLAEAGHVVVIVKQPLGIAFLSTSALDAARREYPDVARWVVGGHSLGGTVAAMEADGADAAPTAPVVGLLLFASYPAGDISTSLDAAVLSVSGGKDGLATPAKIEASRATLPAGATFTVVDGAVHAFFGDYGPQPGDGTPAISHDDARARIARAALDFVTSLA